MISKITCDFNTCRVIYTSEHLLLSSPEVSDIIMGVCIQEVNLVQKTSLSTRGQIVIPVQIRNKLGLKPGARFTVYDLDSKIVLVPELEKPVEHGLGFFGRSEALKSGKEENS